MNAVAPPSRSLNPFATCWTRPGALDWLPSESTVEELLAESDAAGGGQIVGPHGAGKSTLLAAMARALRERGELVVGWTIHSGDLAPAPPSVPQNSVLLIDGAEQLPLLKRWRVLRSCRRRGVRVLLTTHRRLRIAAPPLLASMGPSQATVQGLFDRLTAERPTRVTRDDVARSYHRHQGNVREVWFDLYDRHERLSRLSLWEGSPEADSARLLQPPSASGEASHR